jgi:hypothetical protein
MASTPPNAPDATMALSAGRTKPRGGTARRSLGARQISPTHLPRVWVVACETCVREQHQSTSRGHRHSNMNVDVTISSHMGKLAAGPDRKSPTRFAVGSTCVCRASPNNVANGFGRTLSRRMTAGVARTRRPPPSPLNEECRHTSHWLGWYMPNQGDRERTPVMARSTSISGRSAFHHRLSTCASGTSVDLARNVLPTATSVA